MLSSPNLLTRTNNGTKVTTPGTIRVTITSRNSTRLPAKSIFASAYPTIEQNSRLPSTVTTATIRLLVKNVPKFRSLNQVA